MLVENHACHISRSTTSSSFSTPRIVEFYEQDVLPVLFERLDRVFPEFQWTRTPDGWSGVTRELQESASRLRGSLATERRTVLCRNPWGFLDASGNTVSWLAYEAGGQLPNDHEVVMTIRQLADRAGVDASALDVVGAWESPAGDVRRHERQRELFEAFVGYCHAQLCRGDYPGDAALEYLLREHGINGHETGEWPLGLYTTQHDVQDYLRDVGFSDEEISASRVLRDTRLDGRLIVPWRDRWGNLRTVVAHTVAHTVGHDASSDLSGGPRHLYRKCDATHDAFGLDIALRTTSGGREHLVLVEGFLDVVYFQSRGLTNVATVGPSGKIPTTEQWERLADYGVRQVTLAFADDAAGWQGTLKALGHAYQAGRAPRVFAMKPDAIGSVRSASLCARVQGMGELRHRLSQRLHGFHYVAESLLREHGVGAAWTDAALIGLLNAAIDFDASVYTPQRELELERFFWPPLLDCLDARWPAVQRLLRRPLPVTQRRTTAADRWPAREPVTPPVAPPIVSAPPVVLPMRQETPAGVASGVASNPTTTTGVAQPDRSKPDTTATKTATTAVPVDLQALAYAIWEAKGCPENSHDVCWFEALRRVREEKIETIRHYAKTA